MTSGSLPPMLTPQEVADQFLRTSRKAVYQMVQRGQIPAAVRVGRRILFRTDALVAWLNTKARRFPQE